MSPRPRPEDVVPAKDDELHPTVVLERPKVAEFPARFRSRDAAAEAGPQEGADSAGHWRLEAPGDGRIKRLSLHHLPFRVGRRMDLELVLSTSSISKVHAEIYAKAGTLCVRDLGSTNGTFVNGQRVLDAPLREGDVLHFAKLEYRLARDDAKPKPAPDSTQAIAADTTQSIDPRSLSHLFPPGTRELKELLRDGAVTTLFQPIVRLPEGTVAAYEALGRGRHPRLPESPIELFKIAESLGPDVAAELSRLFRRKAVELVKDRQELPTLFLNTHPAEMAVPGLIDSLESLRSLAPHLDLALEIHESLLTGPSAIAELRKLLSESNIGLAYDDFGAGQARLLELGEAPPHYLKFDRKFVNGIDTASASRRRLLSSLTGLARDLLVKTVAEGIENADELKVCAQLGFTHAQGFYFGRPKAIDQT